MNSRFANVWNHPGYMQVFGVKNSLKPIIACVPCLFRQIRGRGVARNWGVGGVPQLFIKSLITSSA